LKVSEKKATSEPASKNDTEKSITIRKISIVIAGGVIANKGKEKKSERSMTAL
jgi:hypothetical protein